MILTKHRHMNDSRYSQHPRRRFTTLVALALALSSLTACRPTDSTPDDSGKPVLSSVSAEEARAIKIDDIRPEDVSPLPTRSGPLHLDITCDIDAPSALVKHDNQGDIVWAKKSTPRISGVCTSETMTPQGAAVRLLFTSTSGYAVVSPDTRYASFILLRTNAKSDNRLPGDKRTRDFTVADQRAYVVVIETETGKTVRTEEVKGLILGQALTNDTLSVETSLSYYPAGNGHGTITTYSLEKPTAKAATISTDKWLVGATQDSLLLAPSNMSQGHFGSQPLTRLSEGGDVVGTVTGVTDVYRGGWVGRIKDSSENTDQASPTELVHLDSGVTTDVAGLEVKEVALPTAAGLLVSRKTTTGEGQNRETTSTPQFWLSAADDGHRHTENLEQFSTK